MKTLKGFTSTNERRRASRLAWRPSAVEAKAVPAFTLIETIIYLGLFGILMGGAVVAAYNLFESSSRGQTHALVQEESDFLIAKINWVLSGTKSVTTPPAGVPGSSLTVAKWDTALGDPMVVALSGTDITLSRGGNPAVVLNNSNVRITSLVFTHTLASGDGLNPESVNTTLTLTALTPTGQPVTRTVGSTVYLRH